MDSYNEIIKADCDAHASKTVKYMFTDRQINKAIKKCPLKNIKIYYREIFNYDGKEEELKEKDGRFVYTVEGWYEGGPILRSNLLKWELIRFLKNAEEDIRYERACSSSKRNNNGRETGQDTTESTSDTTVSETDTTGHES